MIRSSPAYSFTPAWLEGRGNTQQADALRELGGAHDALKRQFGNKFAGLVLYGSRARGEGRDSNHNNPSDVDVIALHRGASPDEVARMLSVAGQRTRFPSSLAHVGLDEDEGGVDALPAFFATDVNAIDVGRDVRWIRSIGHDIADLSLSHLALLFFPCTGTEILGVRNNLLRQIASHPDSQKIWTQLRKDFGRHARRRNGDTINLPSLSRMVRLVSPVKVPS